MHAPAIDSFITGPFGSLIPRYKPSYSYVYLLHFSEPYFHARHYLGSSCDLEHRLELHRAGQGARLMEVVREAGISFEICRLWRFDTCIEARALERKLKKWHNGLRLCPICQHRQVDILVAMRQGHWPLHLFTQQGKWQPMGKQPLVVNRWQQEGGER